MKKTLKIIASLLTVLLLFANSYGQDNATVKEETYSAILLSQIPDYNRESRNRLLQINQIIYEESSNVKMIADIEKIKTEYEVESAIFDSLNINDFSLETLEKWDKEWKSLNSQLDNIYKPITDKDEQYNKLYNEVNNTYHVWLETLISVKNTDIPDELKVGMVQTKNDFKVLRKELKKMQSQFLTLRSECNKLSNDLFSYKTKITASRENILKNLLIPEQDIIWKAFVEYKADTVLSKKRVINTSAISSSEQYIKQNSTRMLIVVIIFVLFLFAFFYLKKSIINSNYYTIVIENKASSLLINRPILASVIFTWITIAVFADLPEGIRTGWIILMLPILLLLIIELFGRQTILTMFVFSAYYLFRATQFLIDSSLPVSRLVYLIIALVSVLVVVVIIKGVRFQKFNFSMKVLVRFILFVIIILQIASFFFNIVGNVILSNIILIGSIHAIITGIMFLSGYIVVEALVKLILNLPEFKYSNILKNHYNSLFKQIRNILIIVFTVLWFNGALKSFGVKEELLNWLTSMYMYNFEIGTTSISLSNIIAFIFTIHFTVWLSKIVRLFLNEEIFERRNTPKGASGTITLVVRFSIISLGFLMAMAFAGIELEKITIIIGALGVGIGFGLQNIFNNLISGLILAFERPIKIDDIIQVGELTGVVKDIGFRASTVRTYDGSEVIVPNGDIISNQMINWTLSDRKRRLKIDLSVAMDTKPEDVLEVLHEIAHENPDIVQDPAPRPRFLGYGEGTLDFQLLFWIADFDNSFGLGTETMLKLHNKIKERGIVIPFPQRNIKLVDESGSLLKTKKDISE